MVSAGARPPPGSSARENPGSVSDPGDAKRGAEIGNLVANQPYAFYFDDTYYGQFEEEC